MEIDNKQKLYLTFTTVSENQRLGQYDTISNYFYQRSLFTENFFLKMSTVNYILNLGDVCQSSSDLSRYKNSHKLTM